MPYLKSVSFLNDLIGYTTNGLWFLAVLLGLKGMHLGYWYLQAGIGRQKRGLASE